MNIPVASYSFLNTWAICPHQAARKYIINDLPRQAQSKEGARGRDVHEALANRILLKTPLPVGMPYESFAGPLELCCEPERKLAIRGNGEPCDFWDKSAAVKAVLDAPVILEDRAVLFDWKTGKTREDPYELEIGALLLQAHHRDVRTMYGYYVWLAELRVGRKHDLSGTATTWRRIARTMSDVRDACEAKTFAKTPGPLCGWCPVADCEHNREKP